MGDILKPLDGFGEKEEPFQWSIGCDLTVSEMKKAQVLVYSCFKTRFVLGMNVPAYSLGPVLTQKSNGFEREMAY